MAADAVVGRSIRGRSCWRSFLKLPGDVLDGIRPLTAAS
jgi:hypothetical protein